MLPITWNTDSFDRIHLTTHDGTPLSFELEENSEKIDFTPWQIHSIKAFVNINTMKIFAGRLKISFISQDDWDERYCSHPFLDEIVMHSIDKRGWHVDIDKPEPDVLSEILKHTTDHYDRRFFDNAQHSQKYQDEKKKLLNNINLLFLEHMNAMKEFHVDKPMVDYISVEDNFQKNGIGNALYMMTSHFLSDNGFYLHPAKTKSQSGKANFKRFHFENPQMVRTIDGRIAVSPDFEYDFDCI